MWKKGGFALRSHGFKTQTPPLVQRKRNACAPLTPVVTVTLMSALSPGAILQASCGRSQTGLRELRVNHAQCGGGCPVPDRKEAGLSAKLPDSHAEAQWAVMAREQALRDRHPLLSSQLEKWAHIPAACQQDHRGN